MSDGSAFLLSVCERPSRSQSSRVRWAPAFLGSVGIVWTAIGCSPVAGVVELALPLHLILACVSMSGRSPTKIFN